MSLGWALIIVYFLVMNSKRCNIPINSGCQSSGPGYGHLCRPFTMKVKWLRDCSCRSLTCLIKGASYESCLSLCHVWAALLSLPLRRNMSISQASIRLCPRLFTRILVTQWVQIIVTTYDFRSLICFSLCWCSHCCGFSVVVYVLRRWTTAYLLSAGKQTVFSL